jgi:GT2 family glycosyltransferase
MKDRWYKSTVNNDSRVVIITVNIRNAGCTLQFLESASRLEGFALCQVLIVDNNSGADDVSRIRAAICRFSNVELVEAQQNLGYFGAANLGLQSFLVNHGLPDWVIISNNDIVFEDTRFLSRLFQKDPLAVGMLAPAIISALTQHDANPSIRHRPSQLRMLRYRLWLSNYYAMRFKQWLSPYVRRVRYRFYQRTAPPAGAVQRAIYAPHGAFLIFSRQFFEAGGFIDTDFFLYAEEFIVAEMCRRLDLPIVHDPELRVWHAEGQTLGRKLSRSSYLHQRNGFRYAWYRYQKSYPELGPPRVDIAGEGAAAGPRSLTAEGDVR